MLVALRTFGLAVLTLTYLVALQLRVWTSPRAGRPALVRRWMHRYGRHALSLLGGRATASVPWGTLVPGADGRGVGRVFVLNHRSMLDIFVYLSFLDAKALSRADLAGWPIIGLAARTVGTVFVDRSSRRSGHAAVQAMAGALAEGRGILVFPEGTTFAGDEVRPFRNGAFVAAVRAGAQVVPVGLAYESERACFVDESFPAHWKRIGSMGRIRVGVEVGEPLAPGDDPDALRSLAQARVQELVRRARARLATDQGAGPGPSGAPQA